MLVIISKVLVVFIYIGVGFFACKGGLIRQDSVPALNMLVLNIASPCLLISSITSRRLVQRQPFARCPYHIFPVASALSIS